MSSPDDATRPDGIRLAMGRPLPGPAPAGQAATPVASSPAALPMPSGQPSGAWYVPDPTTEESGEHVRPLAALVSFHYLRAAVRRRRAACVLSAVLGLLLGAAFLVLVPATPTAKTTMVLSHDVGVDPARAMATDVNLLATRTVAERTIAQLGLAVRPEDIMDSVKASPATSDVLVLTMAAPTKEEAVRRLTAFSSVYLEFRARQVTAQSEALIQGYNERITTLQTQIGELTKRIQTLTAGGDDGTGRVSDVITQRAQVSSQLGGLQEAVQEATLRRNAIVSASRVIDPPAVEDTSGVLSIALPLLSGLIGGGAFGLGVVLLSAIVSDRLRLRMEVATALDAPVVMSTGRLAPLSRLRRLFAVLPWNKAALTRQRIDLERVARALEHALPGAGRRQRLVVACVDGDDDARYAVAATGVAMQQRGRAVQLVDLTEAGGLERAVADLTRGAADNRPAVVRPTTVPSLAQGPVDLRGAVADDEVLAQGLTGVSLVLADLDPGIGADHLTVWTDRVLLAVTAGRCGVERTRTAGDLVRSARLDLRGAILTRAEADDGSSGLQPVPRQADPEADVPDQASEAAGTAGPHRV